MQAVYAAAASLSMEAKRGRVVHDSPSQLPLSKLLAEGDLVLLLTPGVAPNPANVSMDPFEPLGRAMAAHHPWIRHVPYLPRNGITDTHIVHINLAKLVVFVISGPPRHGQMSQVVLAEMSRSHCEHRPHIVVACCDIRELGPLETSFSTVIQLPSYSPIELETAANLLFQEPERSPTATTGSVVRNLITAPKSWFVDNWDENRDEAAVYGLWCQCFPAPFRLHRFLLRSLLRRDGYAMHYVVRDPGTLEVLGFCATYTTYVDSGGERLIGSMAALVVRPSYRQRGVGLSLHLHALRQLAKTRGVCRLQLGSTFPRIFTGLPSGSPSEDWFKRRGWRMDGRGGPGTGQEACDWLLKFDDWPAMNLVPNGLVFRQCDISEFDRVLRVVEKESRRKDNMGWYDQYAKLADIIHIRDIVLGLEEGTIVATAITYVPNTGSPIADDLPWAGMISDDVGGVTCICIADDRPATENSRDAIMIRLLDQCIHVLKEQGMKRLFIDAVKGGEEGFQSMGFLKWAKYRDVWRDV